MQWGCGRGQDGPASPGLLRGSPLLLHSGGFCQTGRARSVFYCAHARRFSPAPAAQVQSQAQPLQHCQASWRWEWVQGRGKLASNIIPTANSFYPILSVFSSPFYIPYSVRPCSFPTQHRSQTPNPSLQPKPKQPHLKSPISALIAQ